MPLKMLAACGSRACRLPRRKFTRRCTERNDFVDRKQRIKPQRAQRSQAATEFRIISRKDAKAAKRKKYLSELSVLGALAGGISESEMFGMLENLPKPRNFSSIVVHVTKVLARGRFETPSRKTSERSQ